MIRFRTVSAIIIILTLTSCTTRMSYNCPKIILPKDPDNVLKTITFESSPDEVMKAWVATATGYRDWNRVVRKQIGDSQ